MRSVKVARSDAPCKQVRQMGSRRVLGCRDERIRRFAIDGCPSAVVDDSVRGPVNPKDLSSLVRQRYLHHAVRHARIVDGRSVLPRAFTVTVASAIWLDATGSAVAPSKAVRTPVLTSIAQYLSRLARVAAGPEKGLDNISTSARFREAEGNASKKGSIKKIEVGEFEAFKISLTIEERLALGVARRLVHEHHQFSDMIIRYLSQD